MWSNRAAQPYVFIVSSPLSFEVVAGVLVVVVVVEVVVVVGVVGVLVVVVVVEVVVVVRVVEVVVVVGVVVFHCHMPFATSQGTGGGRRARPGRASGADELF